MTVTLRGIFIERKLFPDLESVQGTAERSILRKSDLVKTRDTLMLNCLYKTLLLAPRQAVRHYHSDHHKQSSKAFHHECYPTLCNFRQ